MRLLNFQQGYSPVPKVALTMVLENWTKWKVDFLITSRFIQTEDGNNLKSWQFCLRVESWKLFVLRVQSSSAEQNEYDAIKVGKKNIVEFVREKRKIAEKAQKNESRSRRYKTSTEEAKKTQLGRFFGKFEKGAKEAWQVFPQESKRFGKSCFLLQSIPALIFYLI